VMNLDTRHLVGASRREEVPLRPLDGGASTQRWAHTPARGSTRRLRHALSPPPLVSRSESLAAARESERRRKQNEARVARGRRAWFCSVGNLAQPSD
jgi:hypothetical protein